MSEIKKAEPKIGRDNAGTIYAIYWYTTKEVAEKVHADDLNNRDDIHAESGSFRTQGLNRGSIFRMGPSGYSICIPLSEEEAAIVLKQTA